ncbi:peptidase [Aquibacillus koreensis]|uniref:Peptidase n=1 Tax=Aquibacillus koreensis TaxID=279446 RepID=A0A9X3WKU7_9BACI|nr:peptidase [Aquibacillus koreensis]MCT2536907.1 peptidase [Aquibacillus koreensis]MDC3421962.1 peptidase [Aquibacillus koreensis]
MQLSKDSKLTLYPLTIRDDNKHFIVEDNMSGEFYEMPKICIEAINMIRKGETLCEIEERLLLNYPEDEVELLSFANQLLELDLIETIDGKLINNKVKQNHTPNGFKWLSPVVGKFFFNKISTKIFAGIILINIIMVFIHPHLLPNYTDLFIFDSMMFNIVTYMLITLILIMIHEFGHILAVRSYGLPAKLDIGHRLLFVVFETDLTGAWKLRPQQRNILYTAGICFDQVMLLSAFSLLLIFQGSHPVFIGVLSIIVLDIFIKTVYQCCFYMKTDLYYLCENMTGCYNLMENGKKFLHKWIPLIKPDPSTETFEGEEKVVKYYSIFYICGVVFTIGLFAFYFVPQMIFVYSSIIPALFDPSNQASFWDAIIFFSQSVLMIGLLLYVWRKNRTHKSGLIKE